MQSIANHIDKTQTKIKKKKQMFVTINVALRHEKTHISLDSLV